MPTAAITVPACAWKRPPRPSESSGKVSRTCDGVRRSSVAPAADTDSTSASSTGSGPRSTCPVRCRIVLPVARSSAAQRSSASRARSTYDGSPYAMRMLREAPVDEVAGCPDPKRSITVTARPRRPSSHADARPNTPAPTTTTSLRSSATGLSVVTGRLDVRSAVTTPFPCRGEQRAPSRASAATSPAAAPAQPRRGQQPRRASAHAPRTGAIESERRPGDAHTARRRSRRAGRGRRQRADRERPDTHATQQPHRAPARTARHRSPAALRRSQNRAQPIV